MDLSLLGQGMFPKTTAETYISGPLLYYLPKENKIKQSSKVLLFSSNLKSTLEYVCNCPSNGVFQVLARKIARIIQNIPNECAMLVPDELLSNYITIYQFSFYAYGYILRRTCQTEM